MLLLVIKKELTNQVKSLRLHISLLLTLIVFTVGAISTMINYKDAVEDNNRHNASQMAILKSKAESNLTSYAVEWRNYDLKPRATEFIDNSKENLLPNTIGGTAYYTFSFWVKSGKNNPYLSNFQDLNWAFIIAVLISFVVFLLSYDSISGEKGTKTLAIMLANSISRGTLLFGKYLATIVATILVLLPGMCVSLVIVLLSGIVVVNLTMIIEIAFFLLITVIFIANIAVFGLLASVVARSARVSLLISLALWILFVTIIPNTALFWSETLFPIEKNTVVEERIDKAKQELNDNAPPGSWSSSRSNPFRPEHELRADIQTKLADAELKIRNEHRQTMFQQFEKTRYFTLLSPISTFEYMSEAVLGGGYLRFRKNWGDIHSYQAQLLQFFKQKDAQDPDSPHWYNPWEDLSTTRKPCSFNEIPVYEEKPLSLAERFERLCIYLLVIVLYSAIVFFGTFVLFVRYDVR